MKYESKMKVASYVQHSGINKMDRNCPDLSWLLSRNNPYELFCVDLLDGERRYRVELFVDKHTGFKHVYIVLVNEITNVGKLPVPLWDPIIEDISKAIAKHRQWDCTYCQGYPYSCGPTDYMYMSHVRKIGDLHYVFFEVPRERTDSVVFEAILYMVNGKLDLRDIRSINKYGRVAEERCVNDIRVKHNNEAIYYHAVERNIPRFEEYILKGKTPRKIGV